MFKMLKKSEKNTYKKRLENQMYLAVVSPEPVYDISDCHLSEVPKTVFSYCKVLQKKSLLLYKNKLKHFDDGLRDLHTIEELDLNSNKLTSISSDICFMTSLSHLDLSHNKLSNLPNEFALLKNLRKLKMNNNCFKSFPDVLVNIISLHHLDISQNKIDKIPKQLHQLRSLRYLNVDNENMVYPSKEICRRGTEAIMEFLCIESNVKYEPVLEGEVPDETVTLSSSLPLTPVTTLNNSQNFNGNIVSNSISNLDNVLLEYERLKRKKQDESVELERRMLEHQQQQAMVAAQASINKNAMLQFLSEECNRFNDEMDSVHKKKIHERYNLIETLKKIEESSSNLVEKFVNTNEQARRTEELMDKIEKERLENEQWYIVKKEEVDNLRKKDIAASFEEMLKNSELMENLLRDYVDKKQSVINHSLLEMSAKDVMLDEIFCNTKSDKEVLINKLLNEEQVQKKAFEMLQYERDCCHVRVAKQIKMVEDQLCQLTSLELDKKATNLENQMNVMEDNRAALTALLKQLLMEKEKREDELKKRLLELEDRSNTHQANYWLVQYQRLLDSKPQLLYNETYELDHRVADVLERAGVGEFKAIFAHKKISMESLLSFSEKDLKNLGVSNETIRHQIMSVLESIKKEKGNAVYEKVEASAPAEPTETTQTPKSSTATSQLNTECVICLSEMSDVLFLNCGHICTCQQCSLTLTHCPMDREVIEQKIKIYITT